MRALLDVNVLIALLDTDHVDHDRARSWLEAEIAHGWASCALTQNGFVRLVSQPRYPSPVSPPEALELLARATQTEHHVYWPCGISLVDPQRVESRHLLGSDQVTDLYLLALAVEHGGRFVTFDRSVPMAAVRGFTEENLTLL